MRSEEFIPQELRKWLQPPRLNYILTGLGLLLAIGVCAVGMRIASDARLVPGTTRLTEVEQERIARLLLSEGLSQYEFTDGVLMVPHGQRTEYLKVARTVSVGPRAPGSSLKRVDEMSPFLAREERLRRIQIAEGEMVAELLRAIEGVDEVYVHFDEALIGGLHQKREIKAGVSVRPTDGYVIDAQLLSSIRRTVAAHKAGLVEANVTVTNLRSGESYDGSIMPFSRASQTLAIEKATIEREWQESVSRILQFIPGAKVEATVEFESAIESAEQLAAFQPSSLVVAVSVPVSYYRQLWAQSSQANAGASPDVSDIAALESQTQEKIESLVTGLKPAGGDGLTLNVAVFQELDAANPNVPRMNAPLVNWLRRNSDKFMQALMVLLAIGLVYFAFRDLFYEDVEEDDEVSEATTNKIRVAPETSLGSTEGAGSGPGAHRVVGSHSAAESHRSVGLHRAEGVSDADHESVSASGHEKSFVNAELTDLVREHPQAASAMLKSWVEKAG